MALRMSPVSRNLHAKVTLLGLELEDMLFLAMACAIAMLVGQFLVESVLIFGCALALAIPGVAAAAPRLKTTQTGHAEAPG